MKDKELSDKEFIESVISDFSKDKGDDLSVKDLLKNYEIKYIDINELHSDLKNIPNKILLIDARSEKEFSNASIPFAKNFPVLTNEERHYVGIIYKKYSQSAAIKLALKYAVPKTEDLKKFIETNGTQNKKIIVHCWRGGGRSAYLSKMIYDLGFEVEVLSGGIKSFRKEVNKFFDLDKFPFELLEISGLTGCGKTELLNSVSQRLPVIDLEFAAKHFSSLLGHIPFEIKGVKKVTGQSEFENNIYNQIRLNNSEHCAYDNLNYPFLIESESRRVGKFTVPEVLYKSMESASSIKLTGSMSSRVNRIVGDYFSDKEKGIELMTDLFKTKGNFFKQQLSNKIFDELLILLEKGDVYDFTEIMIKDYYDKRYREKKKIPISEINSDNMESASDVLIELYKKKYIF
ncbi:MAG TPA: tRNA 2-selenouridine(34) synthase MnmH [Ignavibacteria bacterium]|nr:tRNA 2-selenouridine(34) synthase MnmH [Ignavibacteria bacterium]